jgi:hypothetical protein
MAKPTRAPNEGRDQWTIDHFSQSNPTGKGRASSRPCFGA